MTVTGETYVPDGDPCPKAGHGLPTSLLFLPGAGLVSACRKCDEEFLDWYARSFREPAPPVTLAPTAEPKKGRRTGLEKASLEASTRSARRGVERAIARQTALDL